MFVHSDDVPAPMGGGFAAFSTQEAAEQFARDVHGAVVPFDQLSSTTEARAALTSPRDAEDHANN